MQNKTLDPFGLRTPLFLPGKLRQRGKATCPGRTARRVQPLGLPDTPEPHPPGVGVRAAPPSKQQALNKYLWNV